MGAVSGEADRMAGGSIQYHQRLPLLDAFLRCRRFLGHATANGEQDAQRCCPLRIIRTMSFPPAGIAPLRCCVLQRATLSTVIVFI